MNVIKKIFMNFEDILQK